MVEQPLLAAALWLTRLDGAVLLARSAPGGCGGGPADVTVTLDTAAVRQPVDGFGAALTESSVLALDELPKEKRAAALKALFGAEGLGLSMLRVPIGATDFSRGDYSCEEPRRCLDPLLPTLREILALNPRVKLIGSPWSAPASMKTNGAMSAGWLIPSRYPEYAEYLARFAAAARDAGTPLSYLTPVNEPVLDDGNGENLYPTMYLPPAEEASLIGRYLGPALDRAGLFDVKILAFDHNWERADYARDVLSDRWAGAFAAGSAFHCYGGEPAMMAPLYAAFPSKELHMTECAAGSWSGPFSDSFPWAVKQLVIGDLANGARSVTLWNLALDEDGGPKNFGCKDCRGVLTVNRYAGAFYEEPEFYALAHGSLAAPAGSARVDSRIAPAAEGFSAVGLRGPEGAAAVALNESERDLRVRLRAGGTCVEYLQPARSAATARWHLP